jgi:hypothetical protein
MDESNFTYYSIQNMFNYDDMYFELFLIIKVWTFPVYKFSPIVKIAEVGGRIS